MSHKKAKRQKVANFFGTFLNLPDELCKVAESYCDDSYCPLCQSLFPQQFACLSCFPSKVEYQCQGEFFFNSLFRVSRVSLSFRHEYDARVWTYITNFCRYWDCDGLKFKDSFCIPSTSDAQLLVLECAQRKRTRQNPGGLWELSFEPLLKS